MGDLTLNPVRYFEPSSFQCRSGWSKDSSASLHVSTARVGIAKAPSTTSLAVLPRGASTTKSMAAPGSGQFRQKMSNCVSISSAVSPFPAGWKTLSTMSTRALRSSRFASISCTLWVVDFSVHARGYDSKIAQVVDRATSANWVNVVQVESSTELRILERTRCKRRVPNTHLA